MVIQIKKIILENMSQEDKFGIVNGAFNPKDLAVHNLDIKNLGHEMILNKSKLGFAAGHNNSHLRGQIPNAEEFTKQQNDINLISHVMKK